MENNGYHRASNPKPGKQYLLRVPADDDSDRYVQVVFIAYRPNPAEIVIRDRDCNRLAYRVDLFDCKMNGSCHGIISNV